MRVLPLFLLTALAASGASAQTFGLRPAIAPEGVDATTTASTAPALAAKEPVDPYEALGIRAGGFILYPTLTITGGYTTNAAASAGGTGATFATVEPELLIQSDWDRHEFTLTASGGYERFFDGTTADKPSASAKATGRIDLADGWTSDLAAGVDYKLDDIPDGADTAPPVTELTSSAALNGSFGRADFTVEGTTDRSVYGDASNAGVPVDQGDRNNTVFGGRLRVGFDATPVLSPFVEGQIARRTYDRQFDTNSLQRSSTGTAFRAGVAFDHGPLLTGEIAFGTRQEVFDDPALTGIQAFTIDGNLVWAPTELTTVTLDTSTTINPNTDPASSGSVEHDGSLEIAYAWRDNVTLTGTASIANEQFQGTGEDDNTYDVGLGATWKLNRMFWLTADYTHEWYVSSDPTQNYTSDTFKLSLKAQR
ncbi:MAG TPA: outer membrane beta-barrel protein [Bauldia sp.]|nr:outer membrane beta-barrel protein [Bauldia sp.]